jgi:predicted transcriptional regulator
MGTSTKAEVLKMIGGMPENASLDEIIYEIYFRQRVDRGLRELARGQTVSHDEVERSVSRWLKSAGR